LNKFVLKWNRIVHHMFSWRDMIYSGHISAYINSIDHIQRVRTNLITLRSIYQASISWPEVVRNDTIRAAIARYVCDDI